MNWMQSTNDECKKEKEEESTAPTREEVARAFTRYLLKQGCEIYDRDKKRILILSERERLIWRFVVSGAVSQEQEQEQERQQQGSEFKS